MTTRTRRRARNRRSPWSASLILVALGLVLVSLGATVERLGPFAASARAEEIGSDPAPAISGIDVSTGAPVLAPSRVHPGTTLQVDDFYIHIPAGAVEPLTPILVLHGMGDVGQDFSELVRPRCDAEHWMIVAPTFKYGDWRDPAVLTRESAAHFPRINDLLDRLPAIAGMSVRPQAFVWGFSRGAQAAHRYAMAYPERVAGVAMMSAGTYTLPTTSFLSPDGLRPLAFPYGVSNLEELFGQPFNVAAFQRIPFWVAVGGRDDDPTEVPHQWDPYVGANRVERAQRFAQWLQQAGVSTELRVFQNTGHSATPEVSAAAMDFISAHS